MFRIWMRAINPGITSVKALATYKALLQENLSSGFGKAIVWILLGGAIAGVIQGFTTFAVSILQDLPFGSVLQTSLAQVIRAPISSLIQFLVSTVAILIVAKLLGGKGGLSDQSYLLAAILAPMTILFSISALVAGAFVFVLVMIGTAPEVAGQLAGLLVLPLQIYAGWLFIVAVRAPHGYSAARAFTTMLLAGIVLWPVYSLFT